jgi:ankyrin repeat protein
MFIAMERHCKVVSLLFENDSDIHAVNDYGQTALMEAALWRRREFDFFFFKAPTH